MSRFKRIISLMVAVMVAVSGIHVFAPVEVSAATSSEWQKSAIVSPKAGDLIGAGYIDIKWNNDLENAKSYTVYFDGAKKGTVNKTSEAVMSYEVYTTGVSVHTAYIVATLTNGATVKTDTRTFYVTKKGICIDSNMGKKLDGNKLNIGWYYNWGYQEYADVPSFTNTTFDDIEYVPMIWGMSQYGKKADVFNLVKEKDYKYMLGFNEPDLTDQAGISVATALRNWSDFCDKGLKLGSPVTATAPCWSTTWFEPFMKGINASTKLYVDFVAVHCYWQTDVDSNRGALQFLEAIDQTYAMYGKPIWITEFSVAGNKHFDFADAKAVKQVSNFMKIVLEGLNSRPYVERFSWFSFDTRTYDSATKTGSDAGASGLWHFESGELTALGKLYADMCNPAGYKGTSYNSYKASGVNTSIKACVASVKTNIYAGTTKSTKKKRVKVTIQPVNNAKGYQIAIYKTKKNAKKNKKAIIKKKAKKATVTIKSKKLKSKKKFYIRARAYKKVAGKTYYCAWSKTVKVKIK